MVHHWWCTRMVRADHSALFDANLVYSELTLAEAQCRLAEIPASHRGGCQVGIQAVKAHLHKELFNCPEALWVLHLSLYPFNISYPGPSHALAKCLCLGCWNMDESGVHVYPFTWMSVGNSSKQYTSPPATSPLLTPAGPRAGLLQRGVGRIEGKGK